MRLTRFFAVTSSVCLLTGLSSLPLAAQESILPAADQVQQDLSEQPDSAEAYIREILGITDEQATQIREIFVSYEMPIDEATAEYFASLDRLDSLLMPETPSTAISEAYFETTTNQQALYALLLERNLAIREVLTVEQRSQINSYVRALLDLESTVVAVIPEPAVPFPENLIGLDFETAMTQLEADGWVYATQIGGTAYFDKDGQQLELDLNNADEVVGAYVQ